MKQPKMLALTALLAAAFTLSPPWKPADATVTNTTTQTQTAYGDGTTTNYTIGFDFRDNTWVTVTEYDISTVPTTVTVIPYGSGAGKFTITGGAGDPGTTVVMGTAPTTTQYLIIGRTIPLTQVVEYDPASPFPAADHEEQMDQMELTLQDINAAVAAENTGAIWGGITGTLANQTDLAGALAATLQASNNLSDVGTAATALNNLLPNQTSNSGKVLETNGTNASWQTSSGGSTPLPSPSPAGLFVQSTGTGYQLAAASTNPYPLPSPSPSGMAVSSNGTGYVLTPFPSPLPTPSPSGLVPTSNGTGYVLNNPNPYPLPNPSPSGLPVFSTGTGYALRSTIGNGPVVLQTAAVLDSPSVNTQIGIFGGATGFITILPQTTAGTYNFNLPTSAGSSGQALLSGGGGSSPMTWGPVVTNPMMNLGDMIYGGSSGTATQLVGNTTTTSLVLAQTGTGSASAAPVWTNPNTLLGGANVPTVKTFLAAPTGATNYWYTVSSANATVGATYTNNSQTFTVLFTVATSTSVVMSGTGTPAASGTLTKASGTGDSTITFSAFTGAYITPANLINLRVRGIGGGGGGGGAGGTGSPGTGGTGGTTTFGTSLLTGTGGTGGAGGVVTNTGGGAGGAGTVGSGAIGFAYPGGQGLTAASSDGTAQAVLAGGAGGNGIFGGGGSPVGGATNPGNAGATNTGGGGGGAGANTAVSQVGNGGGAGGGFDAFITTNIATAYPVTVGAAGTGGTAGTSPAAAGGAGAAGRVEVTEYYANGAVGTATTLTGINPVANGGTGMSAIPSGRYFAATATVTSSYSKLTYSTKDYEVGSSGAYASGTLTIPAAGKYMFCESTNIAATFVVNNVNHLAIFQNGTQKNEIDQRSGGAVSTVVPSGCDIINCALNDTIVVEVNSAGTSPTIAADNFENYFSWAWVGN